MKKGISQLIAILLIAGLAIYSGTKVKKSNAKDNSAAIVTGVIELIRVHLPQGLVLLGGGLVCLGLCALLFLLMKLITVGAAKLCKWLWTGVKSLFVGKKGK